MVDLEVSDFGTAGAVGRALSTAMYVWHFGTGHRLVARLKEVERSKLRELHVSANGVRKDLAAVTAGLTVPGTSGLSKDTSTGSKCSSASTADALDSTPSSAASSSAVDRLHGKHNAATNRLARSFATILRRRERRVFVRTDCGPAPYASDTQDTPPSGRPCIAR
nr:hypothetical protein [Streptomyces polyasparticus]